MDGFEDFVHCSSAATRSRIERPRTDARDDLVSRGPLLAARGGAVGSVRPGVVASRWLRCSAARAPSCRRMRRGASCVRPASVPRTPWRWSSEGFRAVKIRIAPDRIDEGIARRRRGPRRRRRPPRDHRRPKPVVADGGRRRAADSTPPARGGSWSGCARYGVLWVEEPLAGEDLRGMRELRASTGVRIARRRDGPDVRGAPAGARGRRARRVPARCRAGAGRVGRAHARPTWRCGATGGSRPTRGPTGSALLANLHVCAESAAARSWSSPTTRPDGRRRGATSCSPSR